MLKKISQLFGILTLVALVGCSQSDTKAVKKSDDLQPMNGEAKILHSWQGDYPVNQLDLLPDNPRKSAVGFIGNAETFEAVWKAFKPGADLPKVDFTINRNFPYEVGHKYKSSV